MFTRRSLVALSAATPFIMASHQSRALDSEDNIVQPLEITDVEIVSISPDATMLIGIQSKSRIAFLDSTSLEIVAISDDVAEITLIDATTIKWSPDSTHIAFSLHNRHAIENSDIYVVDTDTAGVRNLTAVGGDHTGTATPASTAAETKIDMFPVWRDTSTLVFARTRLTEDSAPTDQLVRQQISGSEPEIEFDLTANGAHIFGSPLFMLKDGRILFQTFFEGAVSEIVILSSDGEQRRLQLTGIRVGLVIGESESHLLVNDPENFQIWYMPIENTAEMVDVTEYFGSSGDLRMASAPVFGPEPDSIAILMREAGNPRVILMRSGQRRNLGALFGADEGPFTIQWEKSSVLVMSETKAWIMPVVN